MKATLLIINWLVPLALMATDNLLQGVVAVGWFAAASYLLTRNGKEVLKAVVRFENSVLNLFKIK